MSKRKYILSLSLWWLAPAQTDIPNKIVGLKQGPDIRVGAVSGAVSCFPSPDTATGHHQPQSNHQLLETKQQVCLTRLTLACKLPLFKTF